MSLSVRVRVVREEAGGCFFDDEEAEVGGRGSIDDGMSEGGRESGRLSLLSFPYSMPST